MFYFFDDNISYSEESQNCIIFEEDQNNEIIYNFKTPVDLKENVFIQENQNQDNSSSLNNSYIALSLDKHDTNSETLKKSNNSSKGINQKDESNYNYMSLGEIREILQKYNFTELYNNIIGNENIKDAEYKLCNKKRKRDKDSFIFFKKEEPDKIKRGRKIESNNKKYNREEHSKYSEDNIIKKIKAKILLYPLMFLNNILAKNNTHKKKLYKLDYKYINQLKKEEDMKILKMRLKELYSLDISSKYNKEKDYNKNYIKSIEKNIKDYPTIMFAFNLRLEDWMELFFYKKNINEILAKDEEINNADEETIQIIQNSLIGVEDLLNTILKKEKNDKKYFSIFTLFLYNYKRWFYIKNARN